MLNPVSTYRIQFHKDFSLKDFEKIIPYLQKLGVSTLYASPIFTATPGSTHGYDVVNPHEINPEVGTEKQLKSISKKLQKEGIGWLQDIVPNHMAYNQHNGWLMDVLEKGQHSKYAAFFDVAWNSQLYHGRIMVPFLGSPLEEVLEKKELQVAYEEPRLVLKYYDNAYPLHLRSYIAILKAGKKETPASVEQLLKQLDQLHKVEDADKLAEQWHEFQLQFTALLKDAGTKSYVMDAIKAVNKDGELLRQITEDQAYRLCHWQETEHQINFRRFFTVNSLICLNIQDEEVFEQYHQYIKQLLDDGTIQGLRLDHVDGLYDPTQYMNRLRELIGDNTHITVEKILEPGEELPRQWPIQGNTGYDFLSLVNNLLTNGKNKEAFTQFYQELVDDSTSIHEQIREKKEFILYHRMAGELDNLYHLFLELELADKKTLADTKPEELKAAIGEFLIQCPVYRYYGNQLPLDKEEVAAVQDILSRVRQKKTALAPAVAVLESVLLQKPAEGKADYNQRALRFYQRCMQFTGPLMAKGVEDTLMYTYNRFAGHNEVGDSPESFGMSAEEFHAAMQERQQHWPLSLNATSSHDTKRGEDVRARLNVLSDLPDDWLVQVQEWQGVNWGLKQNGAPDANDEYLIYQTLAGAYPMPEQGEDNFDNRLQEYLQKAMREAKRHSNWSTPNEEYERATKDFASRLLDKKRPFWKDFQKFHKKLVDFGIVNSLAQLVLKFTCPGVPDVYQGTELWDLSLVDPDNRRAVSYEERQRLLEELENWEKDQEELLSGLWSKRSGGQIKLWLIHQLLQQRKEQQELFEKGQYIPLQVEGKHKEHVFAFARRFKQDWCVVAVPLHLASLGKQQKKDIQSIDWKDTRVLLTGEAPADWQHLLHKTKGKAGEKGIAVNELFKNLPLAVLRLQQPVTDRSAGILMHITSLPSPFGLGDFGPEARAFADALCRSRQKYWQLLPLNPTEKGTSHSPYSSYSSMAGNTLLLSPELLAKDGLLDPEELLNYHLTVNDKAEFEKAETNKLNLFEKAYQTYKAGNFKRLKREFDQFCQQEAQWLDNFATYLVIKQEHEDKPWYQWPEPFKQRQEKALKQFEEHHTDAIQKAKWLQFLFTKQWQELKTYCNNLGIQFFGDLPFYVSYDSVDVWANRDIFDLDEEGNMLGVAGVPPDYFNEDGQLWGMPVFKWDVLKKGGYAWWIRRIRKNMELFDVLRLDHFRAFADFWRVPAGEETARNGEWLDGPGADFFKVMNKELGDLPFIAEDLGEVTDAVYTLRDDFMLPGMKVLQFAFGEEMPRSIFIPHNYTPNSVAYTGTHDNNTTRGWYRKNMTKVERQGMEEYVGQIVLEKEVHQVLGRMAYASVSRIAILPIQDVLGLDESARMNMPSTSEGNWLWRLLPGQFTPKHEAQLRQWCRVYHRG